MQDERRRGLLRPEVLLATAVLLLNDHWLKGAGLLPGWLTGKLSDVAGLFIFPILLAKLIHIAVGPLQRRQITALSLATTLLTAAGFTLANIHAGFNAWLSHVWGRMWMDPTDLWTLPILLASAWIIVSCYPQQSESAPSLASRVMVAVMALACVATPARHRPMPPRSCVRIANAQLIGQGKRFNLRVSAQARNGRACTLPLNRLAIDYQLDERVFARSAVVGAPHPSVVVAGRKPLAVDAGRVELLAPPMPQHLYVVIRWPSPELGEQRAPLKLVKKPSKEVAR